MDKRPFIETPDDTLSVFLRHIEPDAKPSADYSAWVLPASKEAGGAANDEKVAMHGLSSDTLLLVIWLACCAAVCLGVL
jgi:hypothetical protein